MLVLQGIWKSFCKTPMALSRVQSGLWECIVLIAGGRPEEAQWDVLYKTQMGLSSSVVRH